MTLNSPAFAALRLPSFDSLSLRRFFDHERLQLGHAGLKLFPIRIGIWLGRFEEHESGLWIARFIFSPRSIPAGV